jgi:hypothetical protein
MFELTDYLQKILLIHILVCAFLYKFKPDFMFDSNGKFKAFGTGPNKTIYPFWLVTTAFSLMVYLFLIVKKDEFVD